MAGPGAELAGCSALVTGASGFIGTHLCRKLSALGADVHGVSRRPLAREPGCPRWYQADLTDPAAADRLLDEARPEFVFHLASHVAGARELERVLPTFRDNLVTTVQLLAAATDFRCRRIVLAGSLEEPDPGDTPAVPSSPYAASKYAASSYARFFHALYGTPTAIARIFMVYGPEQHDLDKLVPYIALSLLRGESPKLSAGTREVDWIYVDDVVDGLLALATAPDVEGSTLDLGSGELVSVRAVAERIEKIVGADAAPRFGAIEDRALEQVRVAAVDETAARTGWRPAVDLPTGLARTVEWCREIQSAADQPSSRSSAH
jgi:nucleoside-diphosphate-sugar epimerase